MYFTIPSRPLTGPEKVGALMIALGAERAASILACLSPEEVELVIAQVSAMRGIDWETREAVLSEFRDAYEAGQGVTLAGAGFAEDLLGRALGPEQANLVAERLRMDRSEHDDEMGFLGSATPEQLQSALADEHPQTIAVVLSRMPADKAGLVLARLPRPVQVEVARRLVDSNPVASEMLAEIDRALQTKAGAQRRTRGQTGPTALANLLSMADRTTERAVLESLDPTLAEQVRKGMFVFEDLPRLDERDLQVVLREAGPQDLALALKGADQALLDLVMRNISERAAAALQEDMELLQRVRPSDVEAAQQRITAIVREMLRRGQVVLTEDESAQDPV